MEKSIEHEMGAGFLQGLIGAYYFHWDFGECYTCLMQG